MIKQYQEKAIDNIGVLDHKKALELLQPSMTTILDYQIERLTEAVESEVNQKRHSAETIEAWSGTLALLKAARELYG